MNQKTVKIDNSSKSVNNMEIRDPHSLKQREKLKRKLMDKYEISDELAEEVLLKIEIKSQKTIKNNKDSKKEQKFIKSQSTANVSSQQLTTKNESIMSKSDKKTILNKSTHNMDKKSQQPQNKQKDIDSLISEIIPDYNQEISIELEHVSVTFEVETEKIDTLKESFVNLFRKKEDETSKIEALKDISFKIYKGEKVGIIGYNGAGKSTLLHIITGVYAPDEGTVKTNGKISPLLGLGAGFDHNCTGRKNIILNGAILGYDKQFLEDKIDEIIEFSELNEFIDIPIKNYSSGMMAKLGFSIATAVEPDILIIDEILGVGDVNFRKKSSDKIKTLMDGGTTVLLVSHSIAQIRALCDKAIWIDNGNLREIGEVNKVCDNYLKDAEKASKEELANIQLT